MLLKIKCKKYAYTQASNKWAGSIKRAGLILILLLARINQLLDKNHWAECKYVQK